MNYELAKELKEAGFHQNTDGGGEVLWPYGKYPKPRTDIGGEMVYAPTLSELIEACGEEFWSLERRKRGDPLSPIDYEKEWIAVEHPRNSDELLKTKCLGDTPEEAISRLWLALNKK